jgi:hypothetical protein
MVVVSCAPLPVYWTGLFQWRSCWLVIEEEPVSEYWHYISYCDFCFSVFLQSYQTWQNSSTVNMARPLIFVFLHINLSWLSSHPFGSGVRLRNSGDCENMGLSFCYIICWRHMSWHVSVAWEGGEGRDDLFNNSPSLYKPIPVAAPLLGMWVRIPLGTWMSFCCECSVLSGRGLCERPIPRPEDSYRVRARARVCVCVFVCHWVWWGAAVSFYTYGELVEEDRL